MRGKTFWCLSCCMAGSSCVGLVRFICCCWRCFYFLVISNLQIVQNGHHECHYGHVCWPSLLPVIFCWSDIWPLTPLMHYATLGCPGWKKWDFETSVRLRRPSERPSVTAQWMHFLSHDLHPASGATFLNLATEITFHFISPHLGGTAPSERNAASLSQSQCSCTALSFYVFSLSCTRQEKIYICSICFWCSHVREHYVFIYFITFSVLKCASCSS